MGDPTGARGPGSWPRGAWRRPGLLVPGVPGVGGARGRERAGPTRSHPEPGRDPAQRRRVLWGRPHGRRGRRGHLPPSTQSGSRKSSSWEDDTGEEPIATSRWLRATHPPRGGAAAARWAHNPKVGGSNPPPATRRERRHLMVPALLYLLVHESAPIPREQPHACFDCRGNYQVLPLRCRICYRSHLSEALRRMWSARHLALCRLQRGVGPVQHSMVRPMWCAGLIFPLQVLVDTHEPRTGEISRSIRRLATRRGRPVQISRGVGTSEAS